MRKGKLEIEAKRNFGERRIVLGKIEKRLFIGIYDSETGRAIYRKSFIPVYKKRKKNYDRTLEYYTKLDAIRKLDELRKNPGVYINKYFP